MTFKDVKKRQQARIIWSEKSGKGATAWEDACKRARLPPKILYTPVMTRFGSIILMLNGPAKCRKGIAITYSEADSPEVRKRKPNCMIGLLLRLFRKN